MIQINQADKATLLNHLLEIQDPSHIVENLTSVLLNGDKENELQKDGGINLSVYSVYSLYYLTTAFENKEIQGILKPKLDNLFKDCPEFFQKAFYSRDLYLYSQGKPDISEFFKGKVLFPLNCKSNGITKTYDELKWIIENDSSGIKKAVDEKIEEINKIINRELQQDYTKQARNKLPFFELFKSLLNPEQEKVADEKYDYAHLTERIRDELGREGKTKSQFRAVQLKESGVVQHPDVVSLYKKMNELPDIKIKDTNGKKKSLDLFMVEYFQRIQNENNIDINHDNKSEFNFYNHVFLAEDYKDSGSTVNARLKLECIQPQKPDGYNKNFFIRMAFKSTNELNVYEAIEDSCEKYDCDMMRRQLYVPVANAIIEVTDMSESTYQQAAELGVCAEIIKQVDQTHYLVMTMTLVPKAKYCLFATGREVELFSRNVPDHHRHDDFDDDDICCDSPQTPHSRVDHTYDPNSPALPEDRLNANSFEVKSTTYHFVSALVLNKELYECSVYDNQPVKDCIEAMEKKMATMGNDLSRFLITGATSMVQGIRQPCSPCSSLRSQPAEDDESIIILNPSAPSLSGSEQSFVILSEPLPSSRLSDLSPAAQQLAQQISLLRIQRKAL